MITTLSFALLALCAQPQVTDTPSTDQVKATVKAVEEALHKGEPADRIAALAKASSVPDTAVAEAVAKALKDRDESVQKAALESLRFMDHPEALDALHSCYKKNSSLRKSDSLSGVLLKAIGQHGDSSSIKVLSDSPFSTVNGAAIRARILGLGNIRDKQSVEELVALMKKVSRRKIEPFMGEFRLAMLRLTGQDEGRSVDLWMKWWNNNKRTFKVAEVAPKMPRRDQEEWDDYWGNMAPRERSKKRGERGGD